MSGRMLTVTTADGPMGLYEAVPDGEVRGGAIVVQEAFGVNEHIRSVADRLAAGGYHAVAPEFFHRAGGGTAPYDDFPKALPLFEGLSDDGVLIDIDAALAHLADAGFTPDRTGLVGFCFGGRVSFLAALRRPFGACVGFYGGGLVRGRVAHFPPLVDQVDQMQCPWLGLFGDLDESIPVTDVETIRAALEHAPVDTHVVRYGDAGHGFFCEMRDSYDEHAATDAWPRVLDWLDEYLAEE